MKRLVGFFSGALIIGLLAVLFLSADESVGEMGEGEQEVVSEQRDEELERLAEADVHTQQAHGLVGEVDENGFDPEMKRLAVVHLVERGVEYIKNNALVEVCKSFTHTQDFIEGELYLFMLDAKGIVYAHGDQSYLLWKNLFDYRDYFGTYIVRAIIDAARKGEGWLTYEWNGAIKVVYVQMIKKDDKEYIIGSGYYPHSKEYIAKSLVKGAAIKFEEAVAEKKPIEDVFAVMSYRLSERFVFGDLFLYALDFDGNIFSQGDRPGLIGKNALSYQDARGVYVNKEIIEKLKDKESGEGIWIEYQSKNARKRAYAQKVTDAQGKHYFFASGYFPDLTRNDAIELVRRGYQLMKSSGKTIAAQEFSDKKINTYRKGDIYLAVYDMNGLCVAHGDIPDNVGQNFWNKKDQDGRYYVREIIQQAKAGGGWVNIKMYGSFESVYVEKIDLGVEQFVIDAGIFPISKSDTMMLMVKSAIGYLASHIVEESFEKFTERQGKFVRGDLCLYVLDPQGYCHVWGDSNALIWQQLSDWKDETGTFFIQDIIKRASKGPDTLKYKMNKRTRVTHFEEIVKNGNKYIVGSGFYL